jgi:hypothetical protein
LYPSLPSGPNWTLAENKANSAIANHKVANATLTDADISVGLWNLAGGSSALKSISSTPLANDVPAVKVTISKSAGKNGGPVSLFFGPTMGIHTVDLSATAIAMMGSPSSVPPNSLFPAAMAKGVYDEYWDSTTNSPKIDPNTGNPYIFNISDEGPQGSWSTFTIQANDTLTIIELMSTGNPTSLAIGDNIWIPPGAKTSIYNDVPINKDVLVAITAEAEPGTLQPIIGFGALHIIASEGGSSKSIKVQFIKDFKISQGSPGGPNYGVYTPPRLAK